MKQIDITRLIQILKWSNNQKLGTQLFEPFLNNEELYECSMALPLIDKTVIGLGDNMLESIENLTNKVVSILNENLDKETLSKLFIQSNNKCILTEDKNKSLCMIVTRNNFD